MLSETFTASPHPDASREPAGGVLSAKTAHMIWNAHHEISQAEKLLAEMRDAFGRPVEVTPRDAFGRHHRNYEFGVPSGQNGHRLYGVSPRLAQTVVEGHIAEMRRQLAEACAIARLELNARATPSPGPAGANGAAAEGGAK